jgi:gliding motility-associated-like protein
MKSFTSLFTPFRTVGCSILLFISAFQSYAQIAPPPWDTAFGAPGGSFEEGIGLQVGNDGNVYIGSRYADVPAYGVATYTVSPPNSGGSTWVSCAKLTHVLHGVWATETSPAGFNYGGNIGIDNNLNTYTLGIINSGGNGWFCTKTNPAGANLWTFNITSSITNWNNPNGVCIDNAGNSYVCGGYNPSMVVPAVGTLNYVGSGADGFVLQLNSSGTAQWAIPLHGAGCDVIAYQDALDYAGNLWVCGGYSGSPTFGTFTLPNAPTDNLFVAELSPATGNVLNVYTAANAGPGVFLCIDSCNNIYVDGQFTGTGQWGTFSATSAGAGDAYVTKLLPNGTFQWVQTGGGAGGDQASGITIDKNWDITIDGYFTTSATFSGQTVTGTGATNAFIAKYASGNGAFMYVQPAGGASAQTDGYYIGTDANRQSYITGTYDNVATFGAISIANGGGCDCSIFVAKIDSTPNMMIIPLPQATYCAGQCYTLPITVIGTFTAGNVFTAELSDPTGSFAAGGTSIGTLTATASGTITICIPANQAPGNNYLLRVTSSKPNYCSIVKCKTITISAGIAALSLSKPPFICLGSSTTLTASGGVTYLWSNGATTTSITVSPATNTTYTIGVSNGTCTVDTSILVTVNPVPTVSITGPATLCSGGNGTLTATPGGGTAPYTYAWAPGGGTTGSINISPSSSQIYTVVVMDANGCSVSGQDTVTVSSTLLVTTTPNASMCAGGSATICANAIAGTGGNTFSWSPGNSTNSCITVTPSTTTNYTVSVHDNCGSKVTANVLVNVNQAPVTNFSADLNEGCSPLCIQFRNTTTVEGGGPLSYEWTFGNGDTSLLATPIYCYPSSGSYPVSLTATSDSGCSSTLKILNMINVYTRPNAAFTYSPQPASILSPTIQFTDQSTDQYGITYWWWAFGDPGDTISTLQNPTHTYQDTGTYCAKLIIMDQHGCTDTATNCLEINPVFTIYIPSAFSPNGDGMNDVFKAEGQFVKTFEMYIFDRWGMQLFYSNNINNGWTGVVKGGSSISQEDIYVYKINVTDVMNNQHSYVGNVTLIK